ncbi:hypothetical protein GCM10025873_11240 [Demequina sediminis]|nr:hypothetical protein GCM10025873_11240 [Demequina sediminis]
MRGGVGPPTYHRRMDSTPASSPTSLRHEAEEALRALVGRGDARLRDDQWTAISALVERRARALVVQRTGWGSPRCTSSRPLSSGRAGPVPP